MSTSEHFFVAKPRKTAFPDGIKSVRERCVRYVGASAPVDEVDALLRGDAPKQGPADELQLLARCLVDAHLVERAYKPSGKGLGIEVREDKFQS